MMERLFLLLIFFSLVKANAQFPVAAIADSLLKNANVVKRDEQVVLVVKSPGKAIMKERHVYTILNERGDAYAAYTAHYSKFLSVNDLSASLYDAGGRLIKRVKKKDFGDFSATDESSLISDDRIKTFDFNYHQYPFTVEFEEENEMNGFFALPAWFPQAAPNLSVEHASFKVIVPEEFKLSYKEQLMTPASVTTEKEVVVYQWTCSNLIPKSQERFSPPFRKQVKGVFLAPGSFEIEGYTGSMLNWKTFGLFFNQLYSGRDQLPESVKADVHSVCTKAVSDKDKVFSLYKYMQSNTRYISIQLGIGGWRPLDAGFVAQKKYGDCKALSNYMVALLKEAGINGYNVLIRAGDDQGDIDTSFASNQFNHVVVCVPMGKDSLWLECTSQTKEPGYMGSFTGDRHALLINETGGYIVTTPFYSAEDNKQSRKIVGTIDAQGKLLAQVKKIASGTQQDEDHQMMHLTTDEQLLKRLKRQIRLANFDVSNLRYQSLSGNLPTIQETFDLVSETYASVSGKRIFVVPNVLSVSNNRITDTSNRLYDIYYPYPYLDEDTVVLTIPKGYSVETRPRNNELVTDFGIYKIEYKIEGDTITMHRFFKSKSGTFAPNNYGVLANFYEQIYKYDRGRFVLVANN